MKNRAGQCLWLLAIAAGCLFVLSGTAMGQCSMCRTALAGAQNALFIRNFNLGVLVLLVPPVTIFCSIFIALKRHRGNQRPAVDSHQSVNDESHKSTGD